MELFEYIFIVILSILFPVLIKFIVKNIKNCSRIITIYIFFNLVLTTLMILDYAYTPRSTYDFLPLFTNLIFQVPAYIASIMIMLAIFFERRSKRKKVNA